MSNKSIRFAFGTILGLASSLALAQDQPTSTRSGVAPSEPAMAAYWQGLSRKLGDSSDAHALLAAALIDGFVRDGFPRDGDSLVQEQSNPDAFSRLIQRSEQSAPDDVLVWWIAATQCRPQGAVCDDAQAAARAQLQRLDPDNASTWLLALSHAHHIGDKAGVRGALAKAAAASHDDDHLIDMVILLTDQFKAYPTPPPAPHLEGAAQASTGRSAAIAAWSIGAALVMPEFKPVMQACTPDKQPVGDPTAYGQCVALAHVMAQGSSLVSSSIGVAMESRLLRGTAQEAEVERSSRALHWMMVNQGAANPDMVDATSRDESAYFIQLRRSRSEPKAIAAQMSAHQIPLHPPAEWKDPFATKS